MATVAVITGGSSGIGASLARALAARSPSIRIIIAGRRSDLLKSVAAFKPEQIVPVDADITTTDGIEKIKEAVASCGLPLQLLVQNAGSIGEIGPLATTSKTSWEATVALNLNAPLYLTQALLPYFGGSTAGRVLHIGSGAASSVIEGWGSYCVSKAGFLMMARVLDAELKTTAGDSRTAAAAGSSRPSLVRVGSVRPGIVDTGMQLAIRTTGDFPAKPKFIGLKEAMTAATATDAASTSEPEFARPPPSGALDDPDNVAAFLSWLLLDTSDDEFGLSTGDEWDIRSAAHQARWCGKVLIVRSDGKGAQ